jgi:hypothetical protein
VSNKDDGFDHKAGRFSGLRRAFSLISLCCYPQAVLAFSLSFVQWGLTSSNVSGLYYVGWLLEAVASIYQKNRGGTKLASEASKKFVWFFGQFLLLSLP